MSTVLPPPAAGGLLLVLPPLLPLLLQPTAAKAIAAKAAIAVVRLMIFLSLFEVVRLPPGALTGPLWAHGLRQPGCARRAGALTAARPPRESIPARIPGRASVAAGTSAADSPRWRRAEQSGVGLPNFVQIGHHLVGKAHRQVLVGMDTGLDLSTFLRPDRAHRR